MHAKQRKLLGAVDLASNLKGEMRDDALAGFDRVSDLKLHLVQDHDMRDGLWGFLPPANESNRTASDDSSGPRSLVPLRALLVWQFCLAFEDPDATRRSLESFFTHPRMQQLEELYFYYECHNAVASFLPVFQQLRVLRFGPGCGLPLSVAFDDRDQLWKALAQLPYLHTLRTPATSMPTQLLPPTITDLTTASPLSSNEFVAVWLAALPLLKRLNTTFPATTLGSGDKLLSPYFLGILGALASLEQLEHVIVTFSSDEQPWPHLVADAITKMAHDSKSNLDLTALQMGSAISRLELMRGPVRPPAVESLKIAEDSSSSSSSSEALPLFFHPSALSSLATLDIRSADLTWKTLISAFGSLGSSLTSLNLALGVGGADLKPEMAATFWRALSAHHGLTHLSMGLPKGMCDDEIGAMAGCTSLASIQFIGGFALGAPTATLCATLPALTTLTLRDCNHLVLIDANIRRILSSTSLHTLMCLRGARLLETDLVACRTLADVLAAYPHINTTNTYKQ